LSQGEKFTSCYLVLAPRHFLPTYVHMRAQSFFKPPFKNCPLAAWPSHPPEEKEIWVRIPPWCMFFMG
jgi:hypothetical protein